MFTEQELKRNLRNSKMSESDIELILAHMGHSGMMARDLLMEKSNNVICKLA